MKAKKQWHDYLWLFSLTYLIFGFFNILFAWIGLICFITPLVISLIKGTKGYCHTYCGRGQLLFKLGHDRKLSLGLRIPNWLRSKYFRYGFLIWFLIMFSVMLFQTYLVFAGSKNLSEIVKLLWVFKVPWNFAYPYEVTPWIAQFAFGFYSVMLTSTIIGTATMILFRPRTWCTFCPMGTMTRAICLLKKK